MLSAERRNLIVGLGLIVGLIILAGAVLVYSATRTSSTRRRVARAVAAQYGVAAICRKTSTVDVFECIGGGGHYRCLVAGTHVECTSLNLNPQPQPRLEQP